MTNRNSEAAWGSYRGIRGVARRAATLFVGGAVLLAGCIVVTTGEPREPTATLVSTGQARATEHNESGCEAISGTGCYWMENTDGRYCWVQSPVTANFDRCYALDSCNGGLGQSGGGCYKWSDCSDCERASWQASGHLGPPHLEQPQDIE